MSLTIENKRKLSYCIRKHPMNDLFTVELREILN